MMHKFTMAALTAATLTVAGQAGAVTITFDEPGILAGTTVISNQYTAVGATFSANAFSGAGSSSSGKPWATNTNMTVVSSSGSDVGFLGTPSLVSGNLLYSLAAWGNLNGDPSFRVSFSTPVNFFSATFAGVSDLPDTRLYFYNGATQLSVVTGTGQAAGQFVLSGSFPTITSVVVMPGSFNDWVGVDNIAFTPNAVPEPATYAVMVLGLSLLSFITRRR